jgi:hypothetical protein
MDDHADSQKTRAPDERVDARQLHQPRTAQRCDDQRGGHPGSRTCQPLQIPRIVGDSAREVVRDALDVAPAVAGHELLPLQHVQQLLDGLDFRFVRPRLRHGPTSRPGSRPASPAASSKPVSE